MLKSSLAYGKLFHLPRTLIKRGNLSLHALRLATANMSTGVTDADIVGRLQKLSISHSDVIEHAPVKGGAEWKTELDKVGKSGVALTKTVSRYRRHSFDQRARTSTDSQLLFKPKTAKTATPTPVLLLAAESSSTPSSALATELQLKELRLASLDLVKEVLPSAQSADDVSVLSISAPAPENVIFVLDSSLASSEEEYAVHLSKSSTTVLVKGKDLKSWIEGLGKNGQEVKVLDFAAAAASPAEPKVP